MIFFRKQFPSRNILGQFTNIFLTELLGVHDFFKCSLASIFVVRHPPSPPNSFSNGTSLMINISAFWCGITSSCKILILHSERGSTYEKRFRIQIR